ncbi:2-dehydropantoate 2-reductase [Halalkalibacter urbisdiaboli]|uniref:2-dehydropantoate 2-reductase n=1 Tax=Halalkalibacter urbisdiaboli TaxID=1960589 RepID=UPI0013FD2EE7|nr:2-dehydropantoate 2-reductase [Halalkalibacter urbisdiaboli]
MKIAIVGAGSIGMLVASFFYSAGHHVILLTKREEQMKELRQHGLNYVYKDTERKRAMIEVNQLDNVRKLEVDCTIIAVKSYEVETILNKLSNLKGSKKAILFLQNGMGHLHMLSNLAYSEVGVAVVEHGALRELDYLVQHTGVGRIKWALFTGGDQILMAMMESVHQPFFLIERRDDWQEMLESKLIVNACINPLTALLKVENGELLHNPHFYKLMQHVFTEVQAILHLEHSQQSWDLVKQVCHNTSHNRSSMLKDVENERKTEVDSIIGYLLIRADKQNIEAPLLNFLYEALTGNNLRRDTMC